MANPTNWIVRASLLMFVAAALEMGERLDPMELEHIISTVVDEQCPLFHEADLYFAASEIEAEYSESQIDAIHRTYGSRLPELLNMQQSDQERAEMEGDTEFTDDGELDPMKFDLNNLDDLIELRYIASIADPNSGVCPVLHAAELVFDNEEVELMYSENSIAVVQETYLQVLPEIQKLWAEHGVAAMSRLDQEYSEPTGYNSKGANIDGSFISLNGVEISISDLIAGVDWSTAASGGPMSFAINFGVDGNLELVASGGGALGLNGNGGDQDDQGSEFLKKNVFDLNKRARDAARAKYLADANGGKAPASETGSEPSHDKTKQRELEAQLIRNAADYEQLNKEWLATARGTGASQVPFVSPAATRPFVEDCHRLINVMKAFCDSCQEGEVQCSGGENMMTLITHRLGALNDVVVSSSDVDSVWEVVQQQYAATTATFAHSVNSNRQATTRAMCERLFNLLLNYPVSNAHQRFTSTLDILVPLLTEGNGNDHDETEKTVTEFLIFVEGGDLHHCAEVRRLAEVDRAFESELLYVAGLLQVTRGDLAHAFLDIEQAAAMGSVNAALSVATMHEHGIGAPRDPWIALDRLVASSLGAHEYFLRSLERIYRYRSVAPEEVGLLRPERFERSTGFAFTMDMEDDVYDTQPLIDATVSALTEKFTRSKSTLVASQLLFLVRVLFLETRSTLLLSSREDAICWTWIIATRTYPPMGTIEKDFLASKCSPPLLVQLHSEMEGLTTTTNDDNDDALLRSERFLRPWIARCEEDIDFFTTSQSSMTLAALQLLLTAPPQEPAALEQRLVTVERILDLVTFLATQMSENGLKEANAIASNIQAGERVGVPRLRWDIGLRLATMLQGSEVDTDHLSPIRLGFIRHETVYLKGLVAYLRKDDALALKWLVTAANVELESPSSNAMLLNSEVASPIDGTKNLRRGESLFLIAHIVASNGGSLSALDDMPEINGHPRSRYATTDAFVESIIRTAAESLRHRPSMAKLIDIRRRHAIAAIAQRDDPQWELEGSMLLQAARSALSLIHERRLMRHVQWLTDWYAHRVIPHTLFDEILESVQNAFGDGHALPTLEPLMKAHRLPNVTTTMLETSSPLAAEALVSVEFLSLVLQQGSPEAIGAMLLFEHRLSPYHRHTQASRMRNSSSIFLHTLSSSSVEVLQEEWDNDHWDATVKVLRVFSLDKSTSFPMHTPESRSEVMLTAQFVTAERHWIQGCRNLAHLTSNLGTSAVDEAVRSCLSAVQPAAGEGSLAEAMGLAVLPSEFQMMLRSRDASTQWNSVTQAMAKAVRSFGMCSGEVIATTLMDSNSSPSNVIASIRTAFASSHHYTIARPECILKLSAIAGTVGLPTNDWREPLPHIALALGEAASEASHKLQLFHQYHTDQSEEIDADEVDGQTRAPRKSSQDEDMEAVDTNDADDEQSEADYNDVGKRKPNLDDLKQKRRGPAGGVAQRRSLHSHAPLSLIDPEGVPYVGYGKWLYTRRMDIVAAEYASTWMQWMHKISGIVHRITSLLG